MRPIDADALKEQVCLDGDCTQCKTGVNEKVCKWNMVQLNDVIERLESAPTIDAVPLEQYQSMEATCVKLQKAIADTPQVVRCKDCKWYELDSMESVDGMPLIVAHEICCFWGNGCKTNPNGFCSFAERKDNG